MTTRRLSWLIGLAALTGAAQYVIQGAMASGANLATFPGWFLIADYALWAVRAFVEASVIVALFQVEPRTPGHARLLLAFEVALIALITLTLGPALYALGQGRTMAETLPGAWLLAWNLAIASYTPLMMAASGAAYRVAMYTPPLQQAIPAPELFTNKRARVRQLAGEHPDWSRAELARAAGCDVSTVTRALHDV
jgi:hypothetical protein